VKALIVIDYTYDFIASDGKLTCGEPGQEIEERITSLTRQFVEKNHFVVLARDVHTEDDPYHPESKLFPPHNLLGSAGRNLYGELGRYVQALTRPNEQGEPPAETAHHVYWMDKTRYSSFAGTDLALQLRARGIEEVHLTGVCTDICVLHTAVDAYNQGFRIVVHADAVQSFNQAGHQWALEHFEQCLGAGVVRGVLVE
jgi:nicotinamidase-related amidase